MIIISPTSLRKETFVNYAIIIFLAFGIGSSILVGFGKVSLGILGFLVIFLYLRKVEDLFLFWLLTFSLFSVDSLAFLSFETHPILTFDRVFISILFFIFLKQIALKERDLTQVTYIEIVFFLLLFAIGLSIATMSINKLTGVRYFTDGFLLPFIIYLLSKNFISTEEYLKKFVSILFLVGIYISLMGIYEYLTGHDLFIEPVHGGLRVTEGQWLRVNGPYQQDYVLGVCCLIIFFVALCKYTISNKTSIWKHIYYISMLTVMVIATFLSFYRGIWLAWALGIFIWFITRKRGLGKLTFALIALVVLAVSFLSALQSSEFYEQRIANTETIEFRLERYSTAWSFFKENPIFGIGFRNYNALTGTTGQQHNQILAFLSETGIIGASLYVLLLFSLLYYAVKRYKSSGDYIRKEFLRAFLCILFVIIVLGFGLNSGFDRQINFLFFAAAGVALSSPKRHPHKDSLIKY